MSIRSLLDGTHSNFELLVRDDGDGLDGTEESVKLAAGCDSRVYYHRNPMNLKLSANVNSGIKASRGTFIAICHDHDLYKPTFLEEMRNVLIEYPSATYFHSAIELIDKSGNDTRSHCNDWSTLTKGGDWLKFMLTSLSCPVCGLTMVRRSVYEEFGLYDTQYGFVADVELWMRLASRGDVAYIKHPLIMVRERESDHYLNGMSYQFALAVFSMHWRYASVAYPGREIKPRLNSLRLLAASLGRNAVASGARAARALRYAMLVRG